MSVKLEPVPITCTSSDCKNNLHCFRKTKAMAAANNGGKCRSCGTDLIDWPRVHRRDLVDAHYTIEALQKEYFRHHFWFHVEMTIRAVNYARRKGRRKLRDATFKQLSSRIGMALPYRDGIQTPREGSDNPIDYAQHATACCCRKCIEVWHGIPQGRDLTQLELDYLADLCMVYLVEKVPALTEDGEKIPSIRKIFSGS